MSEHAQGAMDLEQRLRSLGGRDDLFPATPDVAADMGASIRSQEPADASGREPRQFGLIQDRSLRTAAVLTLVVLTALTAALAVPTSRAAIADFFGIEGIRIELGQGDDVDIPDTPTSIGGSLLLGERTTLDEAAATVPFDVLIPADAAAGDPDEVYLNQRSDVTVLGLLYEVSDDLPPIGETGVGMLLLEIESVDGEVIFAKKSIVGGGTLDITSVNDGTGYWIENGILTVEPIEGLMLDDIGMESRRSDNVLIWSDGEITYRLESSLPMEDAVRIAESLVDPALGGRVPGTGNP